MKTEDEVRQQMTGIVEILNHLEEQSKMYMLLAPSPDHARLIERVTDQLTMVMASMGMAMNWVVTNEETESPLAAILMLSEDLNTRIAEMKDQPEQ